MRYVRFLWFLWRQAMVVEFRYPVQALSNLIGGMIFFAALSAGGKLSGRTLDQSTMVLFSALLMVSAMQGTVKYLDSKNGQLEDLFLFPTRPLAYLLTAGLGSFIGSIAPLMVLFFLLGLILGVDFSGFGAILKVLPPVLLSMLGLGLGLSGLTLVFKRLGSLVQIISTAILALTFAPLSFFGGFAVVFPATSVLAAVQGEAVNHLAIWTSSAAYMLTGILFFSICEHFAVRRGLVGVK